MDQLGWLSAACRGEVGLAPYIVKVEIPVVQKVLSYSTAQALTVIGFQFQLSVAPDVVEVFAHCLKIVAGARQYLHDRLRRPADSPPDLLQLRWRQSAARLARPTAAIAHDVQKRFAVSNPKGPLGHSQCSSWSHWP
jgi:hypothetical protein